jgi:glutathione S-transferase
MKLHDAPHAPNPFTVRLFIAERGGLALDVEAVDLDGLQNRSLAFRAINPAGTVPALELDDGQVLSDIVAICEYLDEVAGGESLIGATPEARALTRMWTRRVDLEIAQPLVSWWRGSDEAVDYYRGHRVPQTRGREENKQIAMRGLNVFNDHLEERSFIAADRATLADILLFGFMTTMAPVVPWLLPPGRRNAAAWFKRMKVRPAVSRAEERTARIEA